MNWKFKGQLENIKILFQNYLLEMKLIEIIFKLIKMLMN